ncbi:hypothetical protein O4J55_04875 [Paracoccus sp. PXZ]
MIGAPVSLWMRHLNSSLSVSWLATRSGSIAEVKASMVKRGISTKEIVIGARGGVESFTWAMPRAI